VKLTNKNWHNLCYRKNRATGLSSIIFPFKINDLHNGNLRRLLGYNNALAWLASCSQYRAI